MPTPTKIVVHFDDGTSREIPVGGMSSVYFNEAAARRAGREWRQETPPGTRNGGDNGGDVAAMADGESCYYVNGVIVCP